MLDFIKTCVRWVTGDPQAMQHLRLKTWSAKELEDYYEHHHKRNLEARIARDLDAAAVWREQRKQSKDITPETMDHYTKDTSAKSEQDNECHRREAQCVASIGNAPAVGSAQRHNDDRMLMPPPPTPNKSIGQEVRRSPRQILSPPSTFDSYSVIAQTMPSTTSRGLLAGLQDKEQEERARRYAEALTLPTDSGYWYVSESGLYFHLGLRGMEALLPAAWMVDFKTFPVILFEQDLEADCLIRNVSGPQFRSIRALRELVEAANRVRDLVQAGHKMVKIQRSLQKSLEDYLIWALSDGDLYATSDSIATHVIMQRKPKQPVVDLIAELALNMDLLLSQHKFFYEDLEPTPESIETALPSPQFSTSAKPSPDASTKKPGEPPKHDDSTGNDPPVILGFLIVHTTVSIFSMNAANNAAARIAGEEGLGIHMLGQFNFIETGQDVWNALALAIACCHVRNSLLAGANPRDDLDRLEEYKAQIRAAEQRGERPMNIDHGRVAGYVSKTEIDAMKKRKRELDDEGGDDDEEEDEDSFQDPSTIVMADVKGKGKAKGQQEHNSELKQNNGRKRAKFTRPSPDDPDR